MVSTELKILFEDKYLLALYKPHGIVSESDTRLQITLESLALQYVQSKEKYPQKCFIGLPHRLDRPVSGVVLFAKKKSVLKILSDLFFKKEIKKTYLAYVEHRPKKSEDELNNWLRKDVVQRKALLFNKEEKGSVEAILKYKVVAENTTGALLQINLVTGKYHQIRAQLSHIGCPIIGDIQYGSTKIYKENAIALHARKLELIHPITNQLLEINAPIPNDEIWDLFRGMVNSSHSQSI